MPAAVLLSERAIRDLGKLGRDRPRIEKILSTLTEEPWPANLDVKTLRGRSPWSRARVGSYRVVFRPLTRDEARAAAAAGRAYLVARVIHRRDLERAIGDL